MGLTEGVISAILLGAASVLPLSASGHLVLVQIWLRTPEHMAATLLAVRCGVVLALVFGLRKSLIEIASASLGWLFQQTRPPEASQRRDAGKLAVAAAIALGMQPLLDAPSAAINAVPTVAGLGLLTSALMLASLVFAPMPNSVAPSLAGACFGGLVHGLAVVPGTSAIATTFVALCWLRVSRWQAARFGLYLSVATLSLQICRGWARHAPLQELGAGRLLLLSLLAFLAALSSLHIFRSLCDKGRSHRLLWWLIPVGLSILLYGQLLSPPATSPTATARSKPASHAHFDRVNGSF